MVLVVVMMMMMVAVLQRFSIKMLTDVTSGVGGDSALM